MSEAYLRGVIVAHASLASALVAATRQISGCDEEALRAISNEGRGPDQLLDLVREATGDAPVVIFTDLSSGSCAFAARKFAFERPATAVVSGVNLPLLLDFVFHRDLPLHTLVDRLVEKGRGGISGICTEETVRADRALSR
jgi:mannose/fructose-specific phosphotransferase system component IIA